MTYSAHHKIGDRIVVENEETSTAAARTLNHESLMTAALEMAEVAVGLGEVPVGAVLVDASGEIVAKAHNRRQIDHDPTAHAEILVLRERAAALQSWRLSGHTLVSTLEPCVMCAGAAVNARIDAIVYGSADLKAGAAWSLYNIPQDARLNHHCLLVAGVLEERCRALLVDFFERRRGQAHLQ